MTDRNISCSSCNTNLGTIRDARLRNDITYRCGKCAKDAKNLITKLRLENVELKDGPKSQPGGPFDDIFGDIFGKGKL